jgi:hypothetical protein
VHGSDECAGLEEAAVLSLSRRDLAILSATLASALALPGDAKAG